LATLERQPCLFHDPVCVAQDFDDLLIVHHIVERYAPSPPSGGEGYAVPDLVRGSEGEGGVRATTLAIARSAPRSLTTLRAVFPSPPKGGEGVNPACSLISA
jgi:hypothetical protein